MAAIDLKDWAKIYAYMWKQHRNPRTQPGESLVVLFEKDPAAAVEKITQGLKQEYKVDIPYVKGQTDLFDWDNQEGRPDTWTPKELEDMAKDKNQQKKKLSCRMCS